MAGAMYAVGEAAERAGDLGKAERYYARALADDPTFAPAAFQLAAFYQAIGQFERAEEILMPVWAAPPVNGGGGGWGHGRGLDNQIRVAQMLIPRWLEGPGPSGFAGWVRGVKETEKVITMAQVLMESLRGKPEYAVAMKNVALALAEAYSATDPARALPALTEAAGGDGGSAGDGGLDQKVISAALNAALYAVGSVAGGPKPPMTDADGPVRPDATGRIRIGYLSPDFCDGSVARLFGVLLTHADTTKYRIFCYYNNDHYDRVTQKWSAMPGVTFTNLWGLSAAQGGERIRQDGVSVLVDLAGWGPKNRADILALRPAAVQRVYMYPGDTGAERILTAADVCYRPYDAVPVLPDRGDGDADRAGAEIRIGALGRLAKHSALIRGIWRSVLEADAKFVLYVQLGPEGSDGAGVYAGFPEGRVRFLPYSADYTGYMQQLGDARLDLMVDTYPYSSRSAMCAALMMGIPVLTNGAERAIGGFAAGGLCGVTGSLAEYKAAILKTTRAGAIAREELRAWFADVMEPAAFMRRYEAALPKPAVAAPTAVAAPAEAAVSVTVVGPYANDAGFCEGLRRAGVGVVGGSSADAAGVILNTGTRVSPAVFGERKREILLCNEIRSGDPREWEMAAGESLAVLLSRAKAGLLDVIVPSEATAEVLRKLTFAPFVLACRDGGAVNTERLAEICRNPPMHQVITGEAFIHGLLLGRPYRTQTTVGVRACFIIDYGAADVVVCGTHETRAFFGMIAPGLGKPFVLVTHNSDENVDYRYASYAGPPSVAGGLIRWFTQNLMLTGAEAGVAEVLPIGIANSGWPHGDRLALMRAAVAARAGRLLAGRSEQRELCYLGSDLKTNIPERSATRALTKWYPWLDQQLTYPEYLELLGRHRFCVCPAGAGVDTHRFWECLYLGVVPVVRAGPWADHWRGRVPMLVVDRWDEVTPKRLEGAEAAAGAEFTALALDDALLDVGAWCRKIGEAAGGLK